MYELFLTALVDDSDFEAACSVLEGFCGMRAWDTIHRVLYFQGPPKPAGIPSQSSIDKPTRKETAMLWKDLHQNLNRQSFILQVRYDLHNFKSWPGTEAGGGADVLNSASSSSNPAPPLAAFSDLDSIPGVLRWTDFPDPPHGRPNITQRKKVELWEQKKLVSVMRDNKHQFKTEIVEETCRFYRDDTEFTLSRSYFTSPINSYDRLEAMQAIPQPAAALPTWENLTSVDAHRRWTLQVKTHVLQDNKPDEIRKAQDQLMALRAELDGVFDFRSIDRKVHDTRIALQQQGVQVLPQKITVGKN